MNTPCAFGRLFDALLVDQVDEDVIECILSNSDVGPTDEETVAATKAALGSIDADTMRTVHEALVGLDHSSVEGKEASVGDALWTRISEAWSGRGSANACKVLLGVLRESMNAQTGAGGGGVGADVDMEGDGSGSVTTTRDPVVRLYAASIYVMLQRFAGARGHGMNDAMTYEGVLDVLGSLAHMKAVAKGPVVPVRGGSEEDEDEDDPMASDDDGGAPSASARASSSARPTRACRSQPRMASSRGGRASSRKQETIALVLNEVAASCAKRMLHVGSDEDRAPLIRTLDAVVGTLGNADVASAARAAALMVVRAFPDAGETPVGLNVLFQTVIPFILGEARPHGVSGSGRGDRPSARSEATARRSQVTKLLGSILDDLDSALEAEGGSAASSSASTGGGAGRNMSSDKMAQSLLVLIEHLCHRAPEKAETRTSVVDVVDTILQRLPEQHQKKFSTFAAIFSRSAKVNHRVFAVDLITEILKSSWIWFTEDDSSMNVNAERLLGMLVSRASDKAPTVRSRALGALSALVGASMDDAEADPRLRQSLMQFEFNCEPPSTLSNRETTTRSEGTTITSKGSGRRSISLRAMLGRRLEDERALVRRAATQAVASVITLHASEAMNRGGGGGVETVDLWEAEVIKLRGLCGDVSVATRKAAATAISSLLLTIPTSSLLQQAWVDVVLPLAHDSEQSVQTRCSELAKDALLERLQVWSLAPGGMESGEAADVDMSVWALLARISAVESQKCLQAALWPANPAASSSSAAPTHLCGSVSVQAVLKVLRFAALVGCGKVDEDEATGGSGDFDASALAGTDRSLIRQGTWIMMEAVLCANPGKGKQASGTGNASAVNANFVISCWQDLWQQLDELPDTTNDETAMSVERSYLEHDAQRMLRVMSKLAATIPADDASALAAELLALLQNFEASAATAASMLKALVALCSAKAPSVESAQQICLQWAVGLLGTSEQVLASYAFPDSASARDAPSIALVERGLHLVGEVAMLAFSADDNGTSMDGPGGRALELTMSGELTSLVRVLVASTLPTAGSAMAMDDADGDGDGDVAMGGEGGANVVPDTVRAYAFVAMGKLCLMDAGLAKESVTLLVRELSTSTAPAVQSNVLLVLGDLCVRYTFLVERHLPAMARCLQAEHPLVRRHALLLLSQLLLQDFLKWRGLLVHRFLVAAVDVDPEVSQLSRYLLSGPLVTKFPHLLANAFVDFVFVANDFQEHPKYRAALFHGAEGGVAVTFEGTEVDESQRFAIYRFLLGCMNDEQRIDLTAKLAHDVLGSVVEGTMSPSESPASMMVLKDILATLRMPEIKVGRGTNAGAEDDPENVLAGAAASMDAAKGRLLSKMSRKQLMDHVVPILLGLKHRFEEEHSPLLKDLMEYLCDLTRSYRAEVKAVLAAEPTLAKELEYDLKNFERDEQRRQKQIQRQHNFEAASNAMLPPSAKTPKSGRKSTGSVTPRSSSKAARTPGAMLAKGARTGSRSTVRFSANGKVVAQPLSTPRLRDRSISRDARLSRTPTTAMRMALSATKYRSADDSNDDDDCVHPDNRGGLSPVPFRMPKDVGDSSEKETESGRRAVVHIGSATKRTWSVQLPSAEKENSGNADSENVEMDDSTASPTVAKKAPVGDSLASLASRGPAHRTPHNGNRKKKRVQS